MKNLLALLAIVALTFTACEEDSLELNGINISLNRTSALANLDTLIISSRVFDANGDIREDLTPSFFVNDQLIDNTTFIPDQSGQLNIYATLEGYTSNTVTVEVIDLANLDSLVLDYDGYTVLTTNGWSRSGAFSLRGISANSELDISTDYYTLYEGSTSLDAHSGLQFQSPGTKTINAQINNLDLSSSEVRLEVRAEEIFELVTIPIIFHTYGVDVNNQQLNQLLDTLNAAFNSAEYDDQQVLSNRVNPNAIDMRIRFELAKEDPNGNALSTVGRNLVLAASDEMTILSDPIFASLATENTWDPTRYINIWIVEQHELQAGFENAPGFATGIANSPIMLDNSIEGLQTGFIDNGRLLDPEELYNCIILVGGSVLGEHRDYTVRNMAFFLGLFPTADLAPCNGLDSDYCPDTYRPDFARGKGPDGIDYACDGSIFRQSNHLATGRNYTNFTFDQRARVRAVLGNAYYRP